MGSEFKYLYGSYKYCFIIWNKKYRIQFMKTSLSPISEYKGLVSKIKTEITEGLARVQKAYDNEKINTYWKIGESIHKHFLKNRIQAEFGKRIFKNLSNDLNISESLLYQMTHFYKAYPKFKPSFNLKWTHYRLLSSVKDESKRNELEQMVSDKNLSEKNLISIIHDFKSGFIITVPLQIKKTKPKILKRSKGKLYHYKMIKTPYADNYLIDFGFNIFKETGLNKFHGQMVESLKQNKSYSYRASNINEKFIYAYKAYIEKVIDGDTIWFQIDLGFNTWTRQSIRFMGVEAEPLGTKQGDIAKRYVDSVLKGIEFVVIKTHKRKGKFGRYLGDIYYQKDEHDPYMVMNQGHFLNQELLARGLVKPLKLN